MYLFEIRCDPKLSKAFKKHNLDIKAVQNAWTLLFNKLHKRKRDKKIVLRFKQQSLKDDCVYAYGTNTFWFHSVANSEEMLNDFLHEFKHWIQAHIEHRSSNLIDYNYKKIKVRSKTYYYNVLEVDARRFSKKYTDEFSRYYQFFLSET